jgi:hypothetical protein
MDEELDTALSLPTPEADGGAVEMLGPVLSPDGIRAPACFSPVVVLGRRRQQRDAEFVVAAETERWRPRANGGV